MLNEWIKLEISLMMFFCLLLFSAFLLSKVAVEM